MELHVFRFFLSMYSAYSAGVVVRALDCLSAGLIHSHCTVEYGTVQATGTPLTCASVIKQHKLVLVEEQ